MLTNLFACNVLKDAAKHDFSDGSYRSPVFEKKGRVYVQNAGDSILVYRLDKVSGTVLADTVCLVFPQKKNNANDLSGTFSEPSLDLDFLTIPIKFRPGTGSIPAQLNNTLNGAVFLGMRNDIYKIRYEKTPLGFSSGKIRHYGISFGLFTGFGPTAMNASVTNLNLSSEYDGIAWSKGLSVIMAVNKVTLGLAAGFDNLIGPHGNIWIYENKPWLGLAFGLNLN
jgi:hypothetical protein